MVQLRVVALEGVFMGLEVEDDVFERADVLLDGETFGKVWLGISSRVVFLVGQLDHNNHN